MKLLQHRISNFGTSMYSPTEGNSVNSQLANTVSLTSRASTNTERQLQSYEQYRKRQAIEKKDSLKSKRLKSIKTIKEPVLPRSLNQKIKREKRIQTGEESPIV